MAEPWPRSCLPRMHPSALMNWRCHPPQHLQCLCTMAARKLQIMMVTHRLCPGHSVIMFDLNLSFCYSPSSGVDRCGSCPHRALFLHCALQYFERLGGRGLGRAGTMWLFAER